MARDNYSYNKYQKELAKKKKKEEKKQSKLERKNLQAKVAGEREASRLTGVPSTPPSAAPEQVSHDDVTVV